MSAVCVGCGAALGSSSSRAKWCSDACRKRTTRAEDRWLRSKAAAEDAGSAVADAVTAELVAAGRLETPAGQAALILARRVDMERSGLDSGSALAAVVREMRAQLDRALADGPVPDDPVDELRARRAAKLRSLDGGR